MQDSIRKIVSSYNLPSRINSLVLRIAGINIQRLGLVSFSDQYRYIAELVDKFQATREDRNAISLDSPIKGDRRTWYDVLSYGKNAYEDEGILTLGDSVDISDRFLVERHKEITHRLLKWSDSQGGTDLTSDEIFADFFGISLRAEAIVKYLEHGGRIYPERKIIHVNLDLENPWIQWGKRDYRGNPLDYFRRHQDVYGRMSRSGLFDFDNGLYCSLRKYKLELKTRRIVRQLEVAIPESWNVPRLSKNDKHEIIAAYRIYNGNASEAARHVKFHKRTILKYWKRNNLEILCGKANVLPNQEREKILAVYDECEGNVKRAAELLVRKKTTIRYIWKKHGLKPRGKGIKFEYPQETIIRICEAWELNMGNSLVTARQFGVERSTIYYIWKKHGLKPRGKGFWSARKKLGKIARNDNI